MRKPYFAFPLVLLLSFFYAKAQEEVTNAYIPENLESLKEYLKTANKTRINSIEGKYSSKIKRAFKNRDERMIEAINDSAYFFDQALYETLNSILEKIYEANPQLSSKDFYFFVKNSIVPNAGSYGDGTFEINLGLFTNLESDDELAFVLCHEIAHQELKHSLKRVTKRVESLNSKETRAKVAKIKSRRYGRTKAGLSLLDELNIDILDHSKEAEVEADSLGYLLFSKTNYKKQASITALNKLKKVDDMVFNYDVKLDSVFNFNEYPFQPFWLEEEISLFDTKEKIDEFKLSSDTIRTHPEIKYRIKKIKEGFDLNSSTNATTQSITTINKIAILQSIGYTIDLKFLDLSIYQLIQKRKKQTIEEGHYYTTMAKVLQRIYLAKKEHDLGKYVPHKNAFSDEKVLNQIRLFLHNLELAEIKKIGLAFCSANSAKVKDSKGFETTYDFFKNLK